MVFKYEGDVHPCMRDPVASRQRKECWEKIVNHLASYPQSVGAVCSEFGPVGIDITRIPSLSGVRLCFYDTTNGSHNMRQLTWAICNVDYALRIALVGLIQLSLIAEHSKPKSPVKVYHPSRFVPKSLSQMGSSDRNAMSGAVARLRSHVIDAVHERDDTSQGGKAISDVIAGAQQLYESDGIISGSGKEDRLMITQDLENPGAIVFSTERPCSWHLMYATHLSEFVTGIMCIAQKILALEDSPDATREFFAPGNLVFIDRNDIGMMETPDNPGGRKVSRFTL